MQGRLLSSGVLRAVVVGRGAGLSRVGRERKNDGAADDDVTCSFASGSRGAMR